MSSGDDDVVVGLVSWTASLGDNCVDHDAPYDDRQHRHQEPQCPPRSSIGAKLKSVLIGDF